MSALAERYPGSCKVELLHRACFPSSARIITVETANIEQGEDRRERLCTSFCCPQSNTSVTFPQRRGRIESPTKTSIAKQPFFSSSQSRFFWSTCAFIRYGEGCIHFIRQAAREERVSASCWSACTRSCTWTSSSQPCTIVQAARSRSAFDVSMLLSAVTGLLNQYPGHHWVCWSLSAQCVSWKVSLGSKHNPSLRICTGQY